MLFLKMVCLTVALAFFVLDAGTRLGAAHFLQALPHGDAEAPDSRIRRMSWRTENMDL
jgi:hypothetical protein